MKTEDSIVMARGWRRTARIIALQGYRVYLLCINHTLFSLDALKGCKYNINSLGAYDGYV